MISFIASKVKGTNSLVVGSVVGRSRWIIPYPGSRDVKHLQGGFNYWNDHVDLCTTAENETYVAVRFLCIVLPPRASPLLLYRLFAQVKYSVYCGDCHSENMPNEL
ncbi:hypothetical protein GOP47_0006164, partial [Adiantum capillus-veneris]